jgi:diphthamide biosynthesis protein 4
MTYTPTHYEILDLPGGISTTTAISAQTLRTAYRRALLRNHPDKSSAKNLATTTADSIYSIDQITQAYTILSEQSSRAAYDKELRLRGHTNDKYGVESREKFHTGVETIDLDDLEVDEKRGIWYRTCRCGDDHGFLIAEQDLEEAAGEGELDVGCRGCSLWLKVLFGVMDDEDQTPIMNPDK